MKTYEDWIPWWVLNPDASCTDDNDAPASDKLHVSKYPLSTNPKEIGKQMLRKHQKFKKHTNYFQLIVITTIANKILKLYNLKKNKT